METQLSISPRVAAALIVRLAKRRLTPVAQAAVAHEPAFKTVFLAGVREAQDAVPMQDLIDVLSLGHPGTGAPLYVLQPVIDLLLEPTKLTTPVEPHVHVRAAKTKKKKLKDVYLDTLKAGAHAQPIAGMAFDVANPEAVAWAEKHAAQLVVDVTTEARKAIRVAVVEGIDNGVAPVETAQTIRAVIGLTERDAGAVMKRQITLLQSGVASRDAAKAAVKYADKLLRSRSQTIARTETMTAANEGQHQLWHQAIDEGLLTGREQKVWITADPCDICEPLEGETVGIDEDFSIDGPPAHPNCRCTVGLV